MWDSVSLPTINLLSKLGLTVQSNLQRCLYNQGLIRCLSLLLELTFLNLNAKSIYFCHYYIKLTEAWITLNSKVSWTCQIKVSIGNVFGCNHQGCNRSNLVMARYARPRSHIPHCPHPRVVTGWQVSTHWVTDASQHIATRHLRPVMGSLAVFLLQWKKRSFRIWEILSDHHCVVFLGPHIPSRS